MINISARSKIILTFFLFCFFLFLASNWENRNDSKKMIGDEVGREYFEVKNGIEADSSISNASTFLLSEEKSDKGELGKVEIAPELVNSSEVNLIDETDDRVISAVEIINDGTLNFAYLSKDMLEKGRFFANNLHKLRDVERGGRVVIEIAEIAAVGYVDDTSIDADGNHGVTVKFSEQNSGYLSLFFSVESKSYYGQIFLAGKHYRYVANSDIVVLVDMKDFVTTRID